MNVLLVGSGITASYIQYLLRSSNLFLLESLSVWEKADRIGGRMQTAALRSNGSTFGGSVDMGAQYITKLTNDFDTVFEALQHSGCLSPFPGLIEGMQSNRRAQTNFVSPVGLSNVAMSFFGNTSVSLGRALSSLSFDVKSKKWRALSSNGIEELYDGVILTCPTTEVFNIGGNFKEFTTLEFLARLSSIRYSSRFALSLCFPSSAWEAVRNQVPWTSRYITDDPILKYISIETRKHYVSEDLDSLYTQPMCLLAHSSIPFYHEQKHSTDAAVIAAMMDRVQHHLPNLPAATDSELMRWEVSQVLPQRCEVSSDIIDGGRVLPTKQDSASQLFIQAGDTLEKGGAASPFLAFAGDYFTESNFEGCLRSASSLMADLSRRYAVYKEE